MSEFEPTQIDFSVNTGFCEVLRHYFYAQQQRLSHCSSVRLSVCHTGGSVKNGAS